MKRIQKLFLSVFLVGILVCIILSERIVEQIPEHETGISASEEEMRGIWAASVLNLDYAGGIIGLNQEKPIKQGFALI